MSIFKDNTIDVFKKIRQIFLKIIVGIVIGEIVLLAILIMTHNANEIIGRLMGTLFLIVVWMVIGMACFRCIEKKQSVAQVLSLICLGSSIFWFIFQLLELWGVIPMFEGSELFSSTYTIRLTPIAKFISVVSNIMFDALIGAWISSIAENGGPIKPLKITALSSLAFIFIVSLIQVFVDNFAEPTVLALYGLAVISLIITWCMAASISRKNKKEKIEAVANNSGANINSEEMQQQIQELVEKEVQKRLEKEKE